jgi:hypothetical protein
LRATARTAGTSSAVVEKRCFDSILARHTETWTSKLNEGCESCGWNDEDGGKVISGFTKVQYSSDDQGELVTVARATHEIEGLVPRFAFTVSDDDVITEEPKPSEAEPE